MELFFPNLSGHLRADAHQSQIIGGDADVDHHTQTIGGGYSQFIPTGFQHPWLQCWTSELEGCYFCLQWIYRSPLGTILEKHAPLVEKYIKTCETPWSNLDCQNARTRRSVLKKLFKKMILLKIKLNEIVIIMQRVNMLLRSMVNERERYFKEKLANSKVTPEPSIMLWISC